MFYKLVYIFKNSYIISVIDMVNKIQTTSPLLKTNNKVIKTTHNIMYEKCKKKKTKQTQYAKKTKHIYQINR